MKLTVRLLWGTIGLTATALAVGYSLQGYTTAILFFITLGMLWLYGERRMSGWAASVMLVCCVVAAAFGILLGVHPGFLLVGMVAALSAWDLDHFYRRIKSFEQVANEAEMERRHILMLLFVDGLGLLLAGAALVIRTHIAFSVAFLLGLAAAWGLGQLIGFLRRESD
jgi:hypothetical protein